MRPSDVSSPAVAQYPLNRRSTVSSTVESVDPRTGQPVEAIGTETRLNGELPPTIYQAWVFADVVEEGTV